jgi:hypothetical protein
VRYGLRAPMCVSVGWSREFSRVRGFRSHAAIAPEPSKLDAGGSVNVSHAVARNNRTGIGHYVSVINLRQTDRPFASERFEDVVLPHLDAAYRLARWLIRNEHDAEDIVQEASLRALRYFRTFAGRNGRAWFLRIVRNTCWSWRAQTARTATDVFDEDEHKGVQLTCDPPELQRPTPLRPTSAPVRT